MGWGRQGPHSHFYCAAQDSTGAEVLGPGWLVWLPLTQAASHPLSMLSTGTPALSYWPIPYTPPQDHQNSLAHLKGNAGASDQEPKGRRWPAIVLQGQLLSSPASRSPGSPGSKHASGWEAAHSVHTLTHTGSPWAKTGTWHGSLGGLQRLWLSSPATNQFRDLGPKLWEPGFEEQEGTAPWQFRERCAGWEINTKRLESLAALLPSDGMGRVPAGVEGGQQVASTESHSGVASYHAGIWLGPTGWLVTSDG